jgi:hypothetical protein
METVFMEAYKFLDFTIQSCIAFQQMHPEDTHLSQYYPQIADQVHQLSQAIDEYLQYQADIKRKLENHSLDELAQILSQVPENRYVETVLHFIWSHL